MDREEIIGRIKFRLIGLFLIVGGIVMLAVVRDLTIPIIFIPIGTIMLFFKFGSPKDEENYE